MIKYFEDDLFSLKRYGERFQHNQFYEIYMRMRKSLIETMGTNFAYNSGIIDKCAFDGLNLGRNDFQGVCPNFCKALNYAFGDDWDMLFKDEWLTEFNSFYLSKHFVNEIMQFASMVGTYKTDDFFYPFDFSMMGDCIQYFLGELDLKHGVALLKYAEMLFANDDIDTLRNVDITEINTPRVKTTIDDTSNFKTEVESLNNFKTTNNNRVYGFNSSSAVDDSSSTSSGNENDNHSKVTTSGVEDDNNTKVTTSGVEDDNNSKRIITQDLQDTFTRTGLDGRFNKFELMKERVEMYQKLVINELKKIIMKEMFMVESPF